MVSLIERSEYLKGLNEDIYLNAFVDFLQDRPISVSDETAISPRADDQMLCALQAIQSSDRVRFEEVYGLISRRDPSPLSDWLYNDILLFSLTIGTTKFQMDAAWLRQVLSVRLQHGSSEKRLLAQTFVDVIDQNFSSFNNHVALMIVMKHILDKTIGEEAFVNTVYSEIMTSEFPVSDSPFVNVIQLKAADSIIYFKDLIDFNYTKKTKQFLEVFEHRSMQEAKAVWVTLLAFSIFITLCFMIWFFTTSPDNRDLFTSIITILPLFGFVGLIPFLLNNQKQVTKRIQSWIYKFYGNELGEQMKKKSNST